MSDFRDKLLVKELLESSETLATTLYLIIQHYFGDDAFFWDPSTIFLELRDEFNAEPSSEVMDRIAAVQVVVTNDAFFNEPDAFINICNTFADGSPSFSVFNPAEPEEIAWTLVEVAFIRDMLEFGDTVKRYIKKMLEIDGYSNDYPEIFDVALGANPNSLAIIDEAQETNHEDQRDVIEQFINDNLKSLMYQVNKVDELNVAFWKLRKEEERQQVTLV
jgi:hypothetical protein